MLSVVKRSLGIRIRGEQASFVALERLAGRIRLLGSGTIPLPAENATPPNSPPGVLRPAFRLKRAPDEVVICLPRHCLILRTLELPAIDDRDLEALLAFELERHLPFPLEEACYAFQRVGRDGGTVKVLIAAVRRSDLDRHLEPLDRLGLRPTAVDVSVLAAANAVLHASKDRNGDSLCLVEQDGRQAEVSLVERGILLSSRAVSMDAASPAPLLGEVLRASDHGTHPPAEILVSGGSDELSGRLSDAAHLPVRYWHPALPSVDASVYGSALKGLVALPFRVDLLPQEKRRRRMDRAVMALFTLLALVGVLGITWGVSTAYRERRTLHLLNTKIASVAAQADQVKSLKGELTRLRDRLQVLEVMGRERGRTLVVLRELVSLLSGDIALTDVSIEGNKLQIRGTTGTSASELIAAFERSSFFENAAFTSAISAQGKDRQGFQIQAFVKDGGKRSAVSGQSPAGRKQP